MIYYNSNIINDWNFGDDNIIKVYRNGAIVFYKFDSEQGGYKVCYAVVDDISLYSETEFEDVYDKATEKWYKLNNLNQYEQYGIYGSGRTICEGSTSRLPQGYTEVEYVENTSTAYINIGISPYNTLGDSFNLESKLSSYTQSNLSSLISCESSTSPYYGCGVRWNGSTIVPFGHNLDIDNPDTTFQQTINVDNTSAFTFHSDNVLYRNDNTPITLFCGMNGSSPWRNSKGKCYSFKLIINNNIVRNLVPCKRDNDGKYGMYDLITDTFYLSPNNVDFSGGEPITPTDCVTTYNGKLTIDDGYEYEWNGSSWVNLGEVSGSSKTSDFKIGDIDTPITSDASLITDGMYGVMLPVSLSANTSSAVALMGSSDSNTLSNLSSHTKTSVISENDIIDYAVWKFHGTATANTFYVENVATKKYFGYSDVSYSSYMPLVDESSKVPTVFSAFTYYSVTAFGICKGNTPYQYYAINDLYGNHNQYNWFNPLSSAGDLNNSYVIYKVKGSDAEYPKYYSEKDAPLDSLTFNTLAEAQAYAEANCVYVGLKAAIGGDRYIFSGDSQSGYEWVYNPSRLPAGYTEVEYVENQNRSYLNTQFKPNQDTRIVAKMQCVTSTQYGRYIGAGAYNSKNAIQFDYESYYNGTLHISWGTQSSWSTYSSCVGDYNVHTYDWDKNYFYRDKGESNQFSATTTYGAFQCTDNLGIFTFIQNGKPSAQYSTEYLFGRMYSFQIYDNGTLVRDLVPCIRDNDSTVGVYDIVNDVFYYPPNYASYPLIAGDPV